MASANNASAPALHYSALACAFPRIVLFVLCNPCPSFLRPWALESRAFSLLRTQSNSGSGFQSLFFPSHALQPHPVAAPGALESLGVSHGGKGVPLPRDQRVCALQPRGHNEACFAKGKCSLRSACTGGWCFSSTPLPRGHGTSGAYYRAVSSARVGKAQTSRAQATRGLRTLFSCAQKSNPRGLPFSLCCALARRALGSRSSLGTGQPSAQLSPLCLPGNPVSYAVPFAQRALGNPFLFAVPLPEGHSKEKRALSTMERRTKLLGSGTITGLSPLG